MVRAFQNQAPDFIILILKILRSMAKLSLVRIPPMEKRS